MEKVTVYYFTKFDINVGANVRSKHRATREAISQIRGELLEETALEVDALEIDGNGFYKK